MVDLELKEKIESLCNSQSIAVMATNCKGHPYTNIVGFALSEDMHNIIFATLKDTCKFDNILNDPRVSLTIDNRNCRASEFDSAAAVTATGFANIIEDDPDGRHRRILLGKLPGMRNFLDMDDCIIVSIDVEKFIYVFGIYETQTLIMHEEAAI